MWEARGDVGWDGQGLIGLKSTRTEEPFDFLLLLLREPLFWDWREERDEDMVLMMWRISCFVGGLEGKHCGCRIKGGL